MTPEKRLELIVRTSVITALIEQHLDQLIDREKWLAAAVRQAHARKLLQGVATRWDKVAALLNGDGGAA